MFTGIVQTIGEVRSVLARSSGARIEIFAPALTSQGPFVGGESIAVNGACLSVAAFSKDSFICDVLAESLRCTALGALRSGSHVHLERALRVGDRLGGHFVSGHVDEAGVVLGCVHEGADLRLRIGCSRALAAQSIWKGSIAIAGVSLTIAALGEDWLEVVLIPTTRRETLLGELELGARVNLEADILGAYAAKILGRASDLTMDKLVAAGFADA